MELLSALLSGLHEGEILDVSVGLHWIAVVARVEGERRCGMSSTLPIRHRHSGEPDVAEAGRLQDLSGLELAGWARSDHPIMAGIGVAALNALTPGHPQRWRDVNAEEMIATLGKDRAVTLVGSFPFVPRLRPRVGRLTVLELEPKEDELPADAAPEVVPPSDVVAITSMSLVNHSLEGILELCNPRASVLLLGPSTPLSPVLFELGIDVLSGAVVTDIEAVTTAVRQGATFRQIHRAGVRLVTMSKK